MTTIHGIDHHGKDKPYPFAEDSLQIACATYLRAQYPNVVWFHSPNGGSRNAIEAAKLKQMGVRPGVSDIIILEPRELHGIKPCGLIIELKAKGGKLQDTQASFIMDVQARGFMAAVVWNFDAFKELIDEYLAMPCT
jgi:hypothetical protein